MSLNSSTSFSPLPPTLPHHPHPTILNDDDDHSPIWQKTYMNLFNDMTTFFSLLPSISSSTSSPSSSPDSDLPFELELDSPLPAFSHYASSSSGSSDGAVTPVSGSPFFPTAANVKNEKEADQVTHPHKEKDKEWEPELLILPPPHQALSSPPTTKAFQFQKKPLPPLPTGSAVIASKHSHTHTHTLPIATPRKPRRPLSPQELQEEEERGRSRWPRLLWVSEVDGEQWKILEKYHQRAVGGELPRLKGRGSREVKEWSRRMEKAGL